MQCRFGRLPFEARIPLGNCNCTTRLRSYTLDRNIVRRLAPGMQRDNYVREIFLNRAEVCNTFRQKFPNTY